MKYIHKIKFCVVFLLPGFFNLSCTHYYYGPNSANVPLLQKKDDGRIAASLSAADETSGFELQSAYAFTNHFGAMFNFYTAYGKKESSSSSSSYSKGSGTYAEVVGGYYMHLKNTDRWIFESYAGAGTGSINNHYSPSEMSKVNATKLFIQPSFGYTNKNGSFQAAISSRFSSVHLNLQQSSSTINRSTDNYFDLEDLKNNNNSMYWEPSFLIRGGISKLKFQAGFTLSKAFKEHIYSTQSAVLSFGLLFSFNGKPLK